MTQKEKMQWDKIQNGIKKVVLLLVLFLLLILVILILFLLPDLIMSFRLFLYDKVPSILKISYIESSKTYNIYNSYIEMMISIISCCITAIMSFFTYRLTRILRMMESERYGANILTAAFRLKKNIENNCWIIFNANKNTETLDKLKYLPNLDEIWFVLRVADEIDKEDVELLENYNDQIKELKEFSRSTDQTRNLESDFCKEFISSSSQFGYTDKANKLLRKLEKIIERSDQDE